MGNMSYWFLHLAGEFVWGNVSTYVLDYDPETYVTQLLLDNGYKVIKYDLFNIDFNL